MFDNSGTDAREMKAESKKGCWMDQLHDVAQTNHQ